MNYLKSRKLRQGMAAAVITAAVTAFVILLNVVVSLLGDRFLMRLDMTEGKAYTLTEATEAFLDTVETDVAVYVLQNEEDMVSSGGYFNQAVELMKAMPRRNSRVKLRFVDLIKDPTFISRYPELPLNVGSVLVESGENTVVLELLDLFNAEIDYTTEQTVITSSKVEQAISSAILNATSEKKLIVSILDGHGEYIPDAFVEFLRLNNFEVSLQNLMTEEINPDADIAVLSAPIRDLSAQEAAKLDAFLENGGMLGKNLFYLASYSQPESMPVLEDFLAGWGVKVEAGSVFETNQNRILQSNNFVAVVDYMEADYAEDVIARGMPFAVAISRPLSVLFEEQNFYRTIGLLEFSVDSGICPPDIDEDWMPTSEDITGPIPCLVLSERLAYGDDGATLASCVLSSGSPYIADEGFVDNNNMANADYILAVLNRLGGRAQNLTISDRSMDNIRLGITSGTATTLLVVLAVLVPLAVLAAGVGTWLRRRHR